MKNRILNIMLGACLFLLPWQTRWIFGQTFIDGQFFEFGTWSLYAVEILVLITFIAFLTMNKIVVRQKYLYPIILFIILAIASSLWAMDGNLALAQSIHLVCSLLLFIMLLQPAADKKLMAGAFIAGLVVPGMFAIAQFTEGQSFASKWLGLAARSAETLGDAVIIDAGGQRILRAYGSFSHPNIFGGYLAIGIPLLLMWIKGAKKLSWMYWYGTAGIFGLFILILTWSQASWIALLIGAFVMAAGYVIHLTRQGKINILRAAQFAAGGFIGLMLAGIIGMALLASGEQRSLNERFAEYSAWPQIMQVAFVQGVGLQNYSLELCNQFSEKEWWQCMPIHNTWLLITSELGIAGLVIAFSILVFSIRFIAKSIKREDQILAFTLLSILFVLSLFDHFLYSSWSGLALLAVAAGFILKEKHPEEVI